MPSGALARCLLVAVLVLAVAACGSDDEGSSGTTVAWYVFDEPSGAFADAAADCTERSEGRYRVELARLPTNADEQREQIARRLAAQDADLDILGMDVIWTAEFAKAGWILPWEGEAATAATEGRLEPSVQTATYQDTLYAAPFTANTQLLWYRDDLTPEPPTTWDEVIGQAEGLAEEDRPHLVQVQGERYEGLVVWFTSLVASAGTSILDEDGTEVVLEREPTEEALRIMRDLSRSVVADPSISTAREDQGRLAWESGSSAFMLNYGFVWPSAQQSANPEAADVASHMQAARYPAVSADLPSRVAIGGINLGIGAFSEHPDLAREAAVCLAEEDHQLDAAVRGGLLPTSDALYEDPELTEATIEGVERDGEPVLAFPNTALIRETLTDAVPRPQTPYYNDVALAIARTLHPTRDIDPEADVDRLRDAIDKALEGKGLL
jgi:multiple sugar transport system substrate-binding protein